MNFPVWDKKRHAFKKNPFYELGAFCFLSFIGTELNVLIRCRHQLSKWKQQLDFVSFVQTIGLLRAAVCHRVVLLVLIYTLTDEFPLTIVSREPRSSFAGFCKCEVGVEAAVFSGKQPEVRPRWGCCCFGRRWKESSGRRNTRLRREIPGD